MDLIEAKFLAEDTKARCFDTDCESKAMEHEIDEFKTCVHTIVNFFTRGDARKIAIARMVLFDILALR